MATLKPFKNEDGSLDQDRVGQAIAEAKTPAKAEASRGPRAVGRIGRSHRSATRIAAAPAATATRAPGGGNTIRVGITAQGYPFPAPTGLVDYRLSKPDGSLAGEIIFHGGDEIAFTARPWATSRP